MPDRMVIIHQIAFKINICKANMTDMTDLCLVHGSAMVKKAKRLSHKLDITMYSQHVIRV
jgi:hypothetical protein